jgi:putative PIN family toxin of toxin-antitoxin system
MLVSGDTLAELQEVLRRSKFDPYVSRALREQFLTILPTFTTHVAIVERIEPCRDPRQDKSLETAVNGQADLLVTGDRALLDMKTFRSIAIVSPSGYLRIARGQP